MTDNVEFYLFLTSQKPICTQSPIKGLLGADEHSRLRSKYKHELGIDLLSDRCANTLACSIISDGCAGRPLPNDPAILSAVKTLNLSYEIGHFRGFEVILVYSKVECESCPFKAQCTTPCASQESYLKRKVKPSMEPKEYMLVPYEEYENGKYKALVHEEDYQIEDEWCYEELPLDCLTGRQKQIFDLIVNQGLEQPRVAYLLGIGQQRVSTHFKRAKAKLAEFGKARKYIKEHGAPQRVIDYYLNNLSQKQIADKEGVNQSNIARSIHNWYKDKFS